MADKEIGREVSMRIRPEFQNSVAFLCVQEKDKTTSELVKKPHGTTFLIELQDEKDKSICWQYFVTARHCIELADAEDIWIRLNRKGTGFEDLLTKKNKWVMHLKADVAIIPAHSLDKRWQSIDLDMSPISTEFFVSSDCRYHGPFTDLFPHYKIANPFANKDGVAVQIGESIYFVGLFTEEYGKTRNRPVVRHGIISRTPDEPIELKRDDDNVFSQLAYLVESFSWPGHSGSPVIWIWDSMFLGYYNPKSASWFASRTTPLVWKERLYISLPGSVQGFLGLVSSHYPIKEQAKITGNIVDRETGKIETELNTGIAVVTPAHYIYELLFDEDVVADRERVRKATEKNKHLPTMDSA
jgi:hypothetical protein